MKTKRVKVYALSTCGWCKKTVAWLKDNGIDAEVVYTDEIADEAQREAVICQAKKHNPLLSFPTVVIDGGKCVVVGFEPEKIQEALNK